MYANCVKYNLLMIQQMLEQMKMQEGAKQVQTPLKFVIEIKEYEKQVAAIKGEEAKQVAEGGKVQGKSQMRDSSPTIIERVKPQKKRLSQSHSNSPEHADLASAKNHSIRRLSEKEDSQVTLLRKVLLKLRVQNQADAEDIERMAGYISETEKKLERKRVMVRKVVDEVRALRKMQTELQTIAREKLRPMAYELMEDFRAQVMKIVQKCTQLEADKETMLTHLKTLTLQYEENFDFLVQGLTERLAISHNILNPHQRQDLTSYITADVTHTQRELFHDVKLFLHHAHSLTHTLNHGHYSNNRLALKRDHASRKCDLYTLKAGRARQEVQEATTRGEAVRVALERARTQESEVNLQLCERKGILEGRVGVDELQEKIGAQRREMQKVQMMIDEAK
ncbi:hypothetical protein FGO68_gene8935 [Halteria grandinella]|uniref:Uncharacterized protein n=1 Tax=Halteria grandinella TaxID=5974 RepID=A0A8J8T1H4_HALGN|nr:hypothetical protein FGO68_gene8935 [Halteria grandinella]